MVSKETVNKVMKNIDRRNVTDVRIYPSIVAFVLALYAVVAVYTLYFMDSGFTEYEKLLQTLGVVVVGMGILLALMNVLASRTYKHNKKDVSLFDSLIELSTEIYKEKGIDGGQYITKMKDRDIDNKGQRTIYLIFLIAVVPAIIATVLMVFDITNPVTVTVATVLFVMSLVICAFVLFINIRYPRKHEKAFIKFTDAFCEGMKECGITVRGYEPVIGVRSTLLMLFLTLITLGMFFIVWVYLSLRDMNRHLDQQWNFENSLVDVLSVIN